MPNERSLDPVMGAMAMAALALLTAACAEEVGSEADPIGATTPTTMLASAGSTAVDEARYTTHLYSEHDADVYSRLGPDSDDRALVRAIHVEIGDRVAAGQVLATLEDDDARIAVQAAEAEAEEARANFERSRELREREVATAAQYDAALSARKRAEAALASAQLALERTRIRAPFAGVVSRRYVRVGEMVEDGRALFRVTEMSPLRARVLVPEDRIDRFRAGGSARLTDVEGRQGTARVARVGPTVDPGSGTREVLLELPDPIDGFRPGGTVTVEPLDESRADGTDR